MKSVTTQTKPSIFTLPSREHWPSEDKFQKNRSTFADDFLNFLADRLPLTKQSKNGDVMSYFFLPRRSLCAICALLKLIGQFCEGFIRPSCKPGFSSNNSDCKIRELFPSVCILLQCILAILGARMLQEFLEY